jgi:hypothetical protein
MLKIEHFVEKFPNFISVSEKFYFKFISDPELPGFGKIFSGSGYKFRIRPDLAQDSQHRADHKKMDLGHLAGMEDRNSRLVLLSTNICFNYYLFLCRYLP